MTMRVGGLASGIDTENIIKELIQAERIPLDKMEQDRTLLEWQRDLFREINKKVKELDDFIADTMRLRRTYTAKTVSSSNETVVTATGSATASEGTISIKVNKLATSAMNISTGEVDKNIDLSAYYGKDIYFYTYNENYKKGDPEENPHYNNEFLTHKITIDDGDTLEDVLRKITNHDSPVRAFYDENSKKVVLETTRTGNYNTKTGQDYFNGAEIGFKENSFFTNVLNMDLANEKGGTDAEFVYNEHLTLTSKDNQYTLNGITYQFKQVSEQAVTLTVSNDIDAAVDKIKEFVEKYNELIDLLNGTQLEKRYRDFPPLTEAQKKEMEEREIELWEEKAKSGILRGDTIISSALTNLRQNLFQKVESGGAFNLISDIGLNTTKNYLDGGKLELDEEKLRTALREDPDSVYTFFSNNVEGTGRGFMNRVEDTLENIHKRINERAGRSYDADTNYTIGRRIKELNNRMDAFEDRLRQIENRYWRQFSAMEKAISVMNNQSMMIMSNFFGQ